MAKILHNDNELYLKCDDCEIVFRHEESDLANTKGHKYVGKDEQMWDSPCCHRRYSLVEADSVNDICAVITHGYRDRKSRDKYSVLNSGGIDWAWPE